MNKQITFYGFVNDEGKLKIDDAVTFSRKLKNTFTKTNVEIVVRERYYQFSSKLRSYFFKVIVPEIQAGYLATGTIKSRQEVYEELKYKFLYYEEVNPETGNYERFIHSLSDNNTQVTNSMMKAFIEKCIIFAATNLDWQVPYPSEDFGYNDLSETQKQTLYQSSKK